MNFLKKIYHIIVKRDVMTKLYTRKFAKFGYSSFLYKPLYIDKNKKNVYIGNNVTILNGARIQIFSKCDKDNCNIKIGDGCYLGYNLSILAGADIDIKKGVLMASNVLISSENHSINPESDLYYMDQPLNCGKIIIEEGCWIGQNAIILPNVKIGKKCVIGAGSIVTKDIPDYSVAVGSPARIIKRFNFDTHKWEKV